MRIEGGRWGYDDDHGSITSRKEINEHQERVRKDYIESVEKRIRDLENEQLSIAKELETRKQQLEILQRPDLSYYEWKEELHQLKHPENNNKTKNPLPSIEEMEEGFNKELEKSQGWKMKSIEEINREIEEQSRTAHQRNGRITINLLQKKH